MLVSQSGLFVVRRAFEDETGTPRTATNGVPNSLSLRLNPDNDIPCTAPGPKQSTMASPGTGRPQTTHVVSRSKRSFYIPSASGIEILRRKFLSFLIGCVRWRHRAAEAEVSIRALSVVTDIATPTTRDGTLLVNKC